MTSSILLAVSKAIAISFDIIEVINGNYQRPFCTPGIRNGSFEIAIIKNQ